MKPYQYKNHKRMVPGYHYVLSLIILSCIIISSINLVERFVSKTYDRIVEAIFFFFVSLALAWLYWFCRAFALKAQDRAIRAEENFRYFVMTGSPFPPGLRLGQIIALRFASDAEFVGLVQKALAEKLKGDEIKRLIVHWRSDFHRV